jgi:hypothetical protein
LPLAALTMTSTSPIVVMSPTFTRTIITNYLHYVQANLCRRSCFFELGHH